MSRDSTRADDATAHDHANIAERTEHCDGAKDKIRRSGDPVFRALHACSRLESEPQAGGSNNEYEQKRGHIVKIRTAISAPRRPPRSGNEIERHKRRDDIARDWMDERRDVRSARGHTEHGDKKHVSRRPMQARAFAE